MTIDLYRPLLAKGIFPAFEALRGRPTVPLLNALRQSERWSLDALLDLQAGSLRRLITHAYAHTAHYRQVLDGLGLSPRQITSVDDLRHLPILDRTTLRASVETRMSDAPPFAVIKKTTSGSSGQPVTVHYNAESRHWRDAIRWRGYGWGGYEIGMRALHYWGMGPSSLLPWWKRAKADLDHRLKRDRYVDCTPRDRDSLYRVVDVIRSFKPQVIVAYAGGAGALARFINERGLMAWHQIPVLTGAEALTAPDRKEIERAFGPAFDTYGCREVMMMASECEAHDGMHASMENMIVELVVRSPDGTVRAALPGETGEVVVTDLHNLACPMIRYATGDLAVARAPSRCACGRGLAKIGQIEGRVTDTLIDATGNAVGGLVFNIVFASIGEGAKNFQVVQRPDRSIVLKVVPMNGNRLGERETRIIESQAGRYLPGVPFSIENVADIPLTPAGKRRVVVVERTAV